MNAEKQEFVILVDINDNETGRMEKLEAHRKALLHRAISVFICNSKGEWLLQRRAFNKYHSNGLWSNTCCSHPFPGESNASAANRRLMEEMGLKAELSEIFQFTYSAHLDNNLSEHELDHVFLGITDEKPVINTSEVVEWKYLNYDDLINDIKIVPEKYTIWLRKIIDQKNVRLIK
jgi:isopentenyl-diphosphate delta-isomerase